MRWTGNFDRSSPLTWITVAAGAALLLAAWRMDAAWFDAHILPDFFHSRQAQWRTMLAARAGLALAGLLTILVAGPLLVRHSRGLGALKFCIAAFAIVSAAAGAIASSEMVLRANRWRSFQARSMHDEPRRQADVRYGWSHVPRHTGSDTIGGRRITYSFDSHGYRISHPGVETDRSVPAILFAGESVMLGYGLDWDETIPAQVGAALGVSTANLAVTGYSTDQAFMRFHADLPQFRCPLGVVSIFMPSFLDRNLNIDRPRLDAGLGWHEPQVGWRIAMLARHAFRYRSAGAIDQGIAMTTAMLRAARTEAQSRGAWALIIVPTFTPETRAEHIIRRRVLDDAGIDYVLVPLDPELRIPADAHPDGRAAAMISAALVARLQREGLRRPRDHAPQVKHCPPVSPAAEHMHSQAFSRQKLRQWQSVLLRRRTAMSDDETTNVHIVLADEHDDVVRNFAERHGLTIEQAQELIEGVGNSREARDIR